MDEVFTKFEDAKKLLEEYTFFGHTVSIDKKDRVRAAYTFRSIKWHSVVYKISTLKVNGDRIIIGTTINGDTLESWEDFVSSLKKLNKIHDKTRRV